MLIVLSEREIRQENERREREERLQAMRATRSELESRCMNGSAPAPQHFSGMNDAAETAVALDLALRCIDRLEKRVRELEQERR